MKSRLASYLPWFLAAAAAHLGLLFAWTKAIDARRPYEVAPSDSVEITLVEAAPEPVGTPVVSTEPEIVPMPSEPEPEPIQEPARPADPSPVESPAEPEAKRATKPLPAARAAAPLRTPSVPRARGKDGAARPGSARPRRDARPRYLKNPPPAYPLASKAAQEEGVVLLNVAVDAEGRPDSVWVRRSSGFPRLDEAALRAVRGWLFSPARIGGTAISSEVQVPVHFQLD